MLEMQFAEGLLHARARKIGYIVEVCHVLTVIKYCVYIRCLLNERRLRIASNK